MLFCFGNSDFIIIFCLTK